MDEIRLLSGAQVISCVYMYIHTHVRVVPVFSLDSIVYCDETQVYTVLVDQPGYHGSV